MCRVKDVAELYNVKSAGWAEAVWSATVMVRPGRNMTVCIDTG